MLGRAFSVSNYDRVRARVAWTGLSDLHTALGLTASDGHPWPPYYHLGEEGKLKTKGLFSKPGHKLIDPNQPPVGLYHSYFVSVVNPAAGHRDRAAPELTV